MRAAPDQDGPRESHGASLVDHPAPRNPAARELGLAGAPQRVEVSRDGRRAYFTNSLYATWDDIFYPLKAQ